MDFSLSSFSDIPSHFKEFAHLLDSDCSSSRGTHWGSVCGFKNPPEFEVYTGLAIGYTRGLLLTRGLSSGPLPHPGPKRRRVTLNRHRLTTTTITITITSHQATHDAQAIIKQW
jgi:hypothetical protein